MQKLLKHKWTLPAVAAVLSASLQLATIGKFSVWHDEGYTAMLKEYGFGEMLQRTALDVHPPLYYLLLKLWSVLGAGNSIVGLRLFSVLCMTAAVVVTIQLVRRFWSKQAAWWVAPFLIVGPVLTRYGQEMRMYGLATLLVVASTWLFLELMQRARKLEAKQLRILWVAYGLSLAALFYTQYFASLVVLAHAVLILYVSWSNPKPRKLMKKLALLWSEHRWFWYALGVFLLVIAPWLPILFDQVQSVKGGFWIPTLSMSSVFSTIASFVFFRSEWRDWRLEDWYAALGAAVVVTVYILYRRMWRDVTQSRLLRATPIVLVAAPVIGLILISLALTSFYYDRYLVPFAPFFYIGLGLGLMYTYRAWGVSFKFGVLSLVLVGSFGYGQVLVHQVGNSYGQPKNDFFVMKQLYAKLLELRQPREPVVAHSLHNYFDIRAYMLESGDQGEPLLFAPNQPGKYGNTSLVYDRKDVLLQSFDQITSDSFWLAAGRDSNVQEIVGENWVASGHKYTYGYSSLTLVIRKQ